MFFYEMRITDFDYWTTISRSKWTVSTTETVLSLNNKNGQTSVNISTFHDGILRGFGHDIPRYISNNSWNFRFGTIFGSQTTVKILIPIN